MTSTLSHLPSPLVSAHKYAYLRSHHWKIVCGVEYGRIDILLTQLGAAARGPKMLEGAKVVNVVTPTTSPTPVDIMIPSALHLVRNLELIDASRL
jgi:hypothetical protein